MNHRQEKLHQIFGLSKKWQYPLVGLLIATNVMTGIDAYTSMQHRQKHYHYILDKPGGYNPLPYIIYGVKDGTIDHFRRSLYFSRQCDTRYLADIIPDLLTHSDTGFDFTRQHVMALFIKVMTLMYGLPGAMLGASGAATVIGTRQALRKRPDINYHYCP